VKRFDGSDGALVTQTQFIHEWVSFLNEQGWDIADGSRGKASYAADADALSAMRAYFDHLSGAAAYGTHAFGEAELRERAAVALSREYGISIEASQVVFTPGGQFGLALTFKLLCEVTPGGVIAVPCPWYLNHHELASVWQATEPFLAIAGDPARHYAFDTAAFDQALSANTRPLAGFLFCNPANPSGQVIRREQWQAIIPHLNAHPEAPILLDEAFHEVVFDESFTHSLLHAAPELQARCFLFRSGTKALGLAGERLAVTVVPQAWTERWIYWQSRLLGNPAISLQVGMTAALEGMGQVKKATLSRYYYANASRLQAILSQALPASAIHPPEGGFYLLADLSCLLGRPVDNPHIEACTGHAMPTLQTDEDIALYLLFGGHQGDKTGVAVMPGSAFGLPREAGIVRLSFSSTPAEVTAIGARVVAALHNATTIPS